MKRYFNLIAITAFVITMASCNKEEYKAPVSTTVNMAGRWYIELFEDVDLNGIGDPSEVIYTYHDLEKWYVVTSNTSQNSADSILFSERYPDNGPLSLFPWFVKFKLPVDYSNLTFKPSTVKNLANFDPFTNIYETVTIIEGKILKGAATLPSGSKGDSIFVNLEFSDATGAHFIFSGHRDSGLPEDQH